MQPGQIHARLAAAYDLAAPWDIGDFLLTDRAAAQRLATSADLHETPETLLLHQDGETLSLSLFLDAELLARLTEGPPPAAIDARYLDDLSAAIEGVSHFLYLVWNAGHARPVTQLELELQAEVDKFVTWMLLLDRPPHPVHGRGLWRWLFERFRLRDGLSAGQRRRYLEANRLAARYCAQLVERLRRQSHEQLLPELRRFYRMPQARKIHYIESLGSC